MKADSFSVKVHSDTKRKTVHEVKEAQFHPSVLE